MPLFRNILIVGLDRVIGSDVDNLDDRILSRSSINVDETCLFELFQAPILSFSVHVEPLANGPKHQGGQQQDYHIN